MTPLAKTSLFMIVAIGLLNFVWMNYAGFGFVWSEVVKTVFVTCLLLSFSYFYTVYRPVEDFAVVMLWTAILIAFSAVGAISSYLFTSLGFPFRDSTFAAFDEAIGFDWLAALAFANQFPWLGKVSTFFYSSSLPLVAATMIYLSFTGRGKRVELFITSLIIACVVTLFASGPLAALGPYVYYNPSIELYQSFAPAVMPLGADSPYIAHIMGLRDGTVHLLSLGNTEGLIVFPSFHTVMSVLMIFALRGCGPMFWVGGIFNLLILMSVPLDGGHYLADMVAGIVVAAVVWGALARWQEKTARETGSQEATGPNPVLVCHEA